MPFVQPEDSQRSRAIPAPELSLKRRNGGERTFSGSGSFSKRSKTSGSYTSQKSAKPSINDDDVSEHAEVDRVIMDSIEHDAMSQNDDETTDESSDATVNRVSDDSRNDTLSSSSRSVPCRSLGEKAVRTRSGRHSIRPCRGFRA